MLSGILSDTLKFTSPTTTNYDISCAYNLAKIADVNIDSYSNEMFKAGTNLSGKSIEEIVTGDLKIYDESNKKIAISQVITLNSEEIFERKNEYIRTINEIKNNRGYDLFILVVTDIIKNGSYIFINEDSINIFKDSLYENFYEGYFISEVLSRKKQVVPMVMDIIS